jgi:hypothetical protein
MKRQPNVMNKSHNQQMRQNVLEYPIMADKLFNHFQHQLQLTKMILTIIKLAAVIKN